MEVGKAPTKGKSTFVHPNSPRSQYCSHDTSRWFQFFLKISCISALLVGAFLPLPNYIPPPSPPPPPIFCGVIFFKQLNNHPSLHGVGQACFSVWLRWKKTSFMCYWPGWAEHSSFTLCIVLPTGDSGSSKAMSHQSFLLGSHWVWPGRKGNIMAESRKPHFTFCKDFLAFPCSLCVMGNSLTLLAGITTPLSLINQGFLSPADPLVWCGFSFFHTSPLTIAEYWVKFTAFLHLNFRLLFKFLPTSVFLHDFDCFYFRF